MKILLIKTAWKMTVLGVFPVGIFPQTSDTDTFHIVKLPNLNVPFLLT